MSFPSKTKAEIKLLHVLVMTSWSRPFALDSPATVPPMPRWRWRWRGGGQWPPVRLLYPTAHPVTAWNDSSRLGLELDRNCGEKDGCEKHQQQHFFFGTFPLMLFLCLVCEEHRNCCNCSGESLIYEHMGGWGGVSPANLSLSTSAFL